MSTRSARGWAASPADSLGRRSGRWPFGACTRSPRHSPTCRSSGSAVWWTLGARSSSSWPVPRRSPSAPRTISIPTPPWRSPGGSASSWRRRACRRRRTCGAAWSRPAGPRSRCIWEGERPSEPAGRRARHLGPRRGGGAGRGRVGPGRHGQDRAGAVHGGGAVVGVESCRTGSRVPGPEAPRHPDHGRPGFSERRPAGGGPPDHRVDRSGRGGASHPRGDRVAMTEEDVLGILRHTGALRTGHFVLSSGRHSDTYVEKARVFEHPDVTVRLGREIASWYEDVVAVVSPAVGAIPLGFATALAAGARFVYAEREGGAMALRRGFAIAPGERVVIVEDVVTTGGSAAEVLALARDRGARVLGVAALVDRAGPRAGLPLRALSRVSAQTWDPDACPLCARDVPAESPGSRHLAEKRRSFG